MFIQYFSWVDEGKGGAEKLNYVNVSYSIDVVCLDLDRRIRHSIRIDEEFLNSRLLRAVVLASEIGACSERVRSDATQPRIARV